MNNPKEQNKEWHKKATQMNKTRNYVKSNTKDQHKEKRKIQLKLAKPKNVVGCCHLQTNLIWLLT
jgi:hypothetical protein